jgi:hypothetical protein
VFCRTGGPALAGGRMNVGRGTVAPELGNQPSFAEADFAPIQKTP